jgi:hypothetical protein
MFNLKNTIITRKNKSIISFLFGATVVMLTCLSAGLVTASINVGPLEGEFTNLLDLDHRDFDENSINITNKWWPLTPGKQLIYEGSTTEDGVKTPHRIVFTVTDLTKIIHGIRVVVVWDRDYSDGKLEETELAFFAQDKKGNVWHLGQYREMFDGPEFTGGRAWMIGHLPGAKAGIMMPANPKTGTPSYSQGYAPAPFYWTDRAKVVQMNQKDKVPYGSFKNVMVIEENNAEEPGALQLKYYAPGVGNIRVGWKGSDKQSTEVLELVEFKTLSPKELLQVRKEALELEKRNWIYGTTHPAEPRD